MENQIKELFYKSNKHSRKWEKYFDVERYLDKCKKIATGVNDYKDIVAFPVLRVDMHLFVLDCNTPASTNTGVTGGLF